MRTIFRNTIGRLWVAVLGWGLGLGVLAGYLAPFYDIFVVDAQGFVQYMELFPPELLAFFGGNTVSLSDPIGFLSIEFFSYMPVVLGFFAVVACTGLIAADEEAGILDLLLAHPVTRLKFFLGRLLAFMVALFAINLLMWLAFVIMVPTTSLGLDSLTLAYPFLNLYAILLLFGMVSLLLSLLLSSRNLATTLGSVFLIASYFLSSLANLDERLKTVAKFSPMNYYQSGDALRGMNWAWFFGLMGISLLLVLISLWRFEKKDIRIS